MGKKKKAERKAIREKPVPGAPAAAIAPTIPPQTPTPKKHSPVLSLLLFAAILLVAIDLRIFQIDTRPPHSDEGVNHLFTETVKNLGYFPYSHENYHGPLFFYEITGLVKLLGDELIGLRMSAILPGVLTIALFAAFAPLEGWTFVLVAALLAAISPSLVFFSRYAIHEPLLVLETLGFALSLLWWRARRSPAFIYLAALSAAGLVTTKESFPLAVAAVGAAFLSLGGWKEYWKTAKEQRTHIFFAYLLFVFLVFLVFSGGFRWPDGIGEMFRAVPQWIRRSHADEGHFKPFAYYFRDVIWQTEPHLILAFAFTLILLLVQTVSFQNSESRILGRRAEAIRFFGVWTVLTFFIYSAIKYKTVWLIINLTLPGTLFLGAVVTAILENANRTARGIGAVLGIAAAIVSWNNMLHYNFTNLPIPGVEKKLAGSIPYGPGNPFSYVHTSPGMVELVHEIEAYWQKNPTAKVLVGLEGYFPLPYYLRKHAGAEAYFIPTDIDKAASEYDIMILDFHKQNWSNPQWTSVYHRLSDYAESTTFFKKLPE